MQAVAAHGEIIGDRRRRPDLSGRLSPVDGVRPVGIFGTVAGQPTWAQHRGEVEALTGNLAADPVKVVSYLNAGAIVLAFMEYVHDIVGAKFEVAGGSAILTDGTFYWRRDTAAYVEHYQVTLPADFMEHVEEQDWTCPAVPPERVLDIDSFLREETHGPAS
jgi:hypothetical protein